MGLQVHTKVTSVGIGKQVGLHTRVIKCRVEHGTLVVVLRIDVNLGKISVPLLAGSTAHTVKIPSGDFGFHILAGTVHIHGRHTYLHQHLLIVFRLELQQSFGSRQQRTTFVQCHGIRDQRIGEWFGELGVEVDILVESPIYSLLASTNFSVADYFQLHLFILLALDAVIQVEDKACIFRLREGVTVNRRTLGRGQFSFHTVAVQENGIVSRFRHFIRVGEGRGIRHLLALRTHGVVILPAYGGHQQHIAVIGTTRTADVCM